VQLQSFKPPYTLSSIPEALSPLLPIIYTEKKNSLTYEEYYLLGYNAV
jgi:hypothetical protein